MVVGGGRIRRKEKEQIFKRETGIQNIEGRIQ